MAILQFFYVVVCPLGAIGLLLRGTRYSGVLSISLGEAFRDIYLDSDSLEEGLLSAPILLGHE